ncbi:MAG: hypothetical protein WCK02_09575 [Bacteroidota bacterium]
MKTEYKTEDYNATKGFLYFFIAIMLFVTILILVGMWLNAPYLGVIGFICFCILPFAFEKKIKQIFTKRIFLEFDDLSFSVTKYHLKNETAEGQLNLKWSEIQSYKFYFSPAKNTILTLYLKNGGSKTWGFKDNKTSKEAIGGESLFSIFHSYIKNYNVDKNNDERIMLNQGFLNSKTGSVIIYSEIVIIISGFIFHLMMHPQSSFLTLLMGFSLVIQQFLKRKQEKALYDTISKLD